jgi:hypothetical protein
MCVSKRDPTLSRKAFREHDDDAVVAEHVAEAGPSVEG